MNETCWKLGLCFLLFSALLGVRSGDYAIPFVIGIFFIFSEDIKAFGVKWKKERKLRKVVGI